MASTNAPDPYELTDVVAIAAGGYHTLALKRDGSVRNWGTFFYGAPAYVYVNSVFNYGYSVGDNVGEFQPPFEEAAVTLEAQQSNIAAIAAGFAHSLALTSSGAVIAWGDNRFGQTAVPADAGAYVVAIAAGKTYSLALKADGTVLAWGQCYVCATNLTSGMGFSVLPSEQLFAKNVGIAAGDNFILALRSDGSLAVANPGPANVRVGYWISDLIKGQYLASQTCGTYAYTGYDFSLGCSIIPPAAKFGVANISSSGGLALAIKNDGSLVTWYLGQTFSFPPNGYNMDSNCKAGAASCDLFVLKDVPAFANNMIAVSGAMTDGFINNAFAYQAHFLALTRSGSVVAWGDPAYGTTTVPSFAGENLSVACGKSHSVALVR